LSEASRRLTPRSKNVENGGQRLVLQEIAPLHQGRHGSIAQPSLHVAARHVQKLWAFSQLGGDGFMKRQAPPIDPLVRPHA
jgi:hypothetical protein